jgi:hypothetical protein
VSQEDFKVLDEQILKRVGADPIKFVAIYGGAVQEECRRLQGKSSHIEAFRFCDRRLQALRKAGVIRYTRDGWVKNGVGDL